MRFPEFYGNALLKQRLSLAVSGGGLSHCYILVGPEGSGKRTLARILAAAMECTGKGEVPCGVCPNCHKIFGEGHPDVITVDSDKATVSIDLIRNMQADAYIRPNEGRKKVYLIPRAQDMQAPAQNALLKLLEEPPAYCSFLLMTTNIGKILPTVRSRSVELTLYPLSDLDLKNALLKAAPNAAPEVLSAAAEQSGGYLGAALKGLEQPGAAADPRLTAVVDALARGDEYSILAALVPLEKLKRQELLLLMQQLYLVLIRAMMRSSGSTALCSPASAQLSSHCTPQQLFSAVEAVKQTVAMLQANGNVGHCVGYLLSAL